MYFFGQVLVITPESAHPAGFDGIEALIQVGSLP